MPPRCFQIRCRGILSNRSCRFHPDGPTAGARVGSRVPHRHCLRPSQRYFLADASARTRSFSSSATATASPRSCGRAIVHSAGDWDELLLPEIEGQQAGARLVFPGDADFAKPKIDHGSESVMWGMPSGTSSEWRGVREMRGTEPILVGSSPERVTAPGGRALEGRRSENCSRPARGV